MRALALESPLRGGGGGGGGVRISQDRRDLRALRDLPGAVARIERRRESVEQLREPLHIRRLVELRAVIEGLRLAVALQCERAAAPRDAAPLAEEADLGLTPAAGPGEKHGCH